MNAEIMNLHSILDIKNPKSLTPSARPWLLEALRGVGWEEGSRVPGGLPEYFAAVFKLLDLPAKPQSVEEVLKLEEVRLTLQSAMQRIQEKEQANSLAEEQVQGVFGDADLSNPAMKTLREGALKAKAEQLRAQEEVFTEDFSDLEEEEAAPVKETVHLAACPCCHWDMNKEYESPELSTEDQRNYLLYVLQGPAFQKTYNLWNGLCTATFKTTTTREEELFTEQYAKDYTDGKISVPVIANQKFEIYHLALSLAGLEFAPELKLVSPPIPSIWSDRFKPDEKETRLSKYMREWFSVCITSRELQNALISSLQDFHDLMRSLQQELYRRDFWSGKTSG